MLLVGITHSFSHLLDELVAVHRRAGHKYALDHRVHGGAHDRQGPADSEHQQDQRDKLIRDHLDMFDNGPDDDQGRDQDQGVVDNIASEFPCLHPPIMVYGSIFNFGG